MPANEQLHLASRSATIYIFDDTNFADVFIATTTPIILLFEEQKSKKFRYPAAGISYETTLMVVHNFVEFIRRRKGACML